MMETREKILSVKDLSQYFKSSDHKELKAVDHISFDVYKGEVFGIVGESGCGKTTTGRSIIKLYDITSGDVYFKGIRISAGIRDYKDRIKAIKEEFNDKSSKLRENYLIDICKDHTNAKRLLEEKNKKLLADETFKNLLQNIRLQSKFKKDLKALGMKSSEEVSALKEKYQQDLLKLKDEKKQLILAEYEKIKQANFDNKNFEKTYYQQALEELKSNNASEAEIENLKHHKLMAKMQMIFQDPISSLDPRMTVRDIIAEGLKVVENNSREEVTSLVYDVLERVGLVHEHANRYPHEFSGGQRQRIGIARSIIMNPELIIADEPVSALDVSIQAQVINILNELRKKMDLTIIFIAHDLSVVKYFSDRIAVMYYGKIVELTSAEELFAHPLHPYTKSLLSAIPLPDPRYERKRQRISYNPLLSHDYSKSQPSLHEIKPGHFVSCNDEELQKYLEELK